MSTNLIRTKNDISPTVRAKMADLLNARLADSLDLYAQAKQAHWNVRGARFLTLHELFDKVAEMAAGQSDELAERAAQLGGEVHGTLQHTAKTTTLRPYPHTIAGGEDHIDALSDSLAAYGKNVREAIDSASDAGDMDTADIFTQVSRATDKMLWFVESHMTPAASMTPGSQQPRKSAPVKAAANA